MILRIVFLIVVGILSVCGGVIFLNYSIVLMLTAGEGFIIFDGPAKGKTILNMSLTLLPFVFAVYFLNRKKQYVIMNTIIYPFILSFFRGFIWLVS
ncbi:hypothetical protein [Paenibacillus taichungensis]|uniref:hypothetical protein n=1 Tax=Paenibacillus taichungensis TaxID=484184 RepID=UPI0039A732B1